MMDFNNIASALSFYIMPIILGLSTVSVLIYSGIKQGKHIGFIEVIYYSFISFISGALLIYATYLLFMEPLKIIYVLGLVNLLIFTGFLVYLFFKKLIDIKIFLLPTVISGALIVLGLGVYVLWRVHSPSTTTLNWDLYHHQLLANLIREGKLNFIASRMSDTFQFDGYSTMFHVLLAASQTIFNSEILKYWWSLELFHLISTIIASFTVGYTISQRKVVGIISAVLGAFIFESVGAYTSLFLIPQNLAATISAVFISRIIYLWKTGQKVMDVPLFIFGIYILLNHTIIGTFALVIIFSILIFIYLPNISDSKKIRIQDCLLLSALVLLIVAPIFFKGIDLGYLNRGEAQYFSYNFSQIIKFIENFYGYLFFIFIPLGLIYLFLQNRSENRSLVFLLFIFLAVLITPIPYTLKLYSLGRYFIHAVMAFGILMFFENFSRKTQIIMVFTLCLTLFAILTVNIVDYKQTPTYKDLYTHVTPGEISMAKIINAEYKNKNALIISDPTTMHILETLSGVNSPAGAYATVHTRRILDEIYFSREETQIRAKVFEIKDLVEPAHDTIILVVGNRFERWQHQSDENKYGIFYNTWTPGDLTITDLESYGFIDFLRRFTDFKEIYSNESGVIFEIKNF